MYYECYGVYVSIPISEPTTNLRTVVSPKRATRFSDGRTRVRISQDRSPHFPRTAMNGCGLIGNEKKNNVLRAETAGNAERVICPYFACRSRCESTILRPRCRRRNTASRIV